jgi:hypothetical protein
MNKGIGIALLVVGIILLAYGINSTHSFASNVSQSVTGSPTNKALWLLIGGAAAAVVGGVMTAMGGRSGKA